MVYIIYYTRAHDDIFIFPPGMWGASRERGAERLENLFKKILKFPPRHLWDYDQTILHRAVWPDIKDSIVSW